MPSAWCDLRLFWMNHTIDLVWSVSSEQWPGDSAEHADDADETDLRRFFAGDLING